ncbi:MAG: hypothetical protein SynsKO_37610 [Synoicihabitans sp.]
MSLAGAFATARAQEGFVISAEDGTATYDFDTQEMVYEDNVRAEYRGAVFLADKIRWQRQDSIAIAEGNAVLQRGDIRLLAEKITYDLAGESYQVENVRFGRDPLYFSGRKLTGSESVMDFEEATLSFGEPGFWTPTLQASRITYNPTTGSIKTSGGRLGLGKFRFLPMPAVAIPLDGPDLLEIDLDGGASNRLGLFARVAATVPIGEIWRAGADVGLFTKRGIMAGPAFGYDWDTTASNWGHGRFTSGYIRDAGDRSDLGVDVLGDAIGRDRGLVGWHHLQRISDALTLSGELNYWSDSEVQRDFRRDEFFPVQVPDSYLELNYATTNSLSGVFIRAQPNDFHNIRQRLPELTWELLPSPLGSGFIHQAQTAAVSLRRDPAGPAAEISTERFDAYYAIQRPWVYQNWLAVTPVAGARLTHYTDNLLTGGDYTRTLGEFGVDAELRFSGTFDYQNELWGIDGLRHLITPRIAYRYIPDADEGRGQIPLIDQRVFATYLEPLGLGARRQIDDLSPTHTLRFAIDQRLQTRDTEYGSRDLAQLTVALDSRFGQPAGARTLSDLHTAIRLSPAAFLDFDLYHRSTPGAWDMAELNTAISLHSADQWRLQFATHYLSNDIQEFVGTYAYRFNEVWEGYTRLHFDSRRSRFVEQTYGARQTIANRWVVGYEISFFEGSRRESDFGLALRFDALRF